MISPHTLSIPRLHPAVPPLYEVSATEGFITPLAIALLEAKVISNEQLRTPANALHSGIAGMHERTLCSTALTAWWEGLQQKYPARHFRWNLCVQEFVGYDAHWSTSVRGLSLPSGWFVITRDQNSDIPRFALARAVGHLENCLEGFGQTVLAVVQDAFRMLPDAFGPWTAAGFCQSMYWDEFNNDEEQIRAHYGDHDDESKTPIQVLVENAAADDLLTRERFYRHMPKWAANPVRVVSREAIERAAREGFEKDVIAACDRIISVVQAPGFRWQPHEIGSHNTSEYNIDGCAVLLWEENDQVGRAIDDWLNSIAQGEFTEAIDASHVSFTSTSIRKYMKRTEQMMQLASATDHLIDLIGDPV